MNRRWLTGMVTGVAVGLVAFVLSESIHAQGSSPPTGRVACVHVIQVFNEYQRQKDLSEEMEALKQRVQDEIGERQNKIDTKQATIDAMDPDDPNIIAHMRELMAMQIDSKNWLDLKQAEMQREIGLWSYRVYKELTEATAAIAQQQGYDLVFYKGEFEVTPMMNPEAIRAQIESNHLLYANPATDITQAVLDNLNAAYRAQPRTPMLQVP